jgi:hypothetical protein
MMKNIYRENKPIQKEEFLEKVSSNNTLEVCEAVINASLSIPDYDWIIKQYKILLKIPVLEIKKSIIVSLGHLARVNEKADRTELLGILRQFKEQPEVEGNVEDAIDDINMFLPEDK